MSILGKGHSVLFCNHHPNPKNFCAKRCFITNQAILTGFGLTSKRDTQSLTHNPKVLVPNGFMNQVNSFPAVWDLLKKGHSLALNPNPNFLPRIAVFEQNVPPPWVSDLLQKGTLKSLSCIPKFLVPNGFMNLVNSFPAVRDLLKKGTLLSPKPKPRFFATNRCFRTKRATSVSIGPTSKRDTQILIPYPKIFSAKRLYESS